MEELGTIITITTNDFDTAVAKAMLEILTDPKVTGGHVEAGTTFAIAGVTFAKMVRNILFNSEEESDNE